MTIFHSEWPKHPRIYQINTWPWLNSFGEGFTLLNLPESMGDLDVSHFDAIWMMGVWERSPKGREIAKTHPDLQEEYQTALRDFKPEDVVGSPYAVHYYKVDSHLGGKEGLELIRKQLKEHDLRLILDYVPNHTALDHPWTIENPDLYLPGTDFDIRILPHDLFQVEDHIIWHGRDPYFYPWSDTAQINAFSEEAREYTIKTLLNIAELCDGVRCDMAMLMTNEIFIKTWGQKVQLLRAPKKDFWQQIIPAVKERFPHFIFLAEVYWDMEWKLMQQGFDYCYDKKLYDRMKNETAKTIRAHLQAEWDYQRRLLRFIENHDELRAITAFGKEKSKAAAILTLTLPGARLIHEGQMQGYKIKLPVQLGRRQVEEVDPEIREFYLNLINAAPGRKMTSGKWDLCRVDSVGDFSNTNLIAHVWNSDETFLLSVVNYSPYQSKGHVKLEFLTYGNEEWSFTDLLKDKEYVYQGENLSTHGLYVDLQAWNGHVFNIKKI